MGSIRRARASRRHRG